MKLHLIETKELLDLEKELGYELSLHERAPSDLPRYYVSFPKGEVMKDRMLESSAGNSNTIDEALQDYAKKISCTRMAFEAYTSNRKEFFMPKIIHTKLYNS